MHARYARTHIDRERGMRERDVCMYVCMCACVYVFFSVLRAGSLAKKSAEKRHYMLRGGEHANN